MNSSACSGIREWGEYCDEFEERKRAARTIPSVIDDEKGEGGGEGGGEEGG